MLIFLSDLHLGSPMFKRDIEIIALYENPEVEKIYVLGDVFDTWERNAFKAAEKYKRLVDVINDSSKTAVVLKGNHDPKMSDMKKIFDKVLVTDRLEIDLFGKTALLVHGHEIDNKITQTLARLWFPLNYVCERLHFNLKAWLRNTYHKFLMWKNNKKYNSLVLKMEKEIVKKYLFKYDILISGHTHVPKLVRKAGMDFVNTGSCVYDPHYVEADNNTILLKRL